MTRERTPWKRRMLPVFSSEERDSRTKKQLWRQSCFFVRESRSSDENTGNIRRFHGVLSLVISLHGEKEDLLTFCRIEVQENLLPLSSFDRSQVGSVCH